MSEFLTETLTPLVEDGSITEEQMLEVIAALEAARPAGGAGGHGQRGHGHRGQGLEAAAEALGMDQAELRDQLRDGSTLAEIAEAQGVEVQVVIDALVAEAEAHLDEKVAEGDLTQEEADERLAEISERITDRVNDGGGRGGEGDQQED
jgi:polyhydroxyalkanoate synthesis regulator phasin